MFLLNLINNELFILTNFKKRTPHLYSPSLTCPTCSQQEETTLHLFECDNTHQERKLTWEASLRKASQLIFKSVVKDIEKTDIPLDNNPLTPGTIQNFLSLTLQRTPLTPKQMHALSIGLLEAKWIDSLKTLMDSVSLIPIGRPKVIKYLEILSQKFRSKFKKTVWIKRCEQMIRLERTLGISARDKKKNRRSNTPSPHHSSTHTSITLLRTTLQSQIPALTTSNISNWIRYGIKWLGFNLVGTKSFLTV